jgi:predicted DNA-binding transcriptional regulator AlpA
MVRGYHARSNKCLEVTMTLLKEREVARMLQCSRYALRRMRRERRGPSWVRIGGRMVRYPETWLLGYLEANKQKSLADV